MQPQTSKHANARVYTTSNKRSPKHTPMNRRTITTVHTNARTNLPTHALTYARTHPRTHPRTLTYTQTQTAYFRRVPLLILSYLYSTHFIFLGLTLRHSTAFVSIALLSFDNKRRAYGIHFPLAPFPPQSLICYQHCILVFS